MQHVQPVQPSHLYGRSFAEAVCVEVGQQDVVAQPAAVHVADVHHADGIVRVAVHDDRRAPGGLCGTYIEGMQLFAPVVLDVPVAQRPVLNQAVHPRLQFGVFFYHVGVRGGKVAAARFEQLRLQGKTSNFYCDLVSDYMDYWAIKKKLIADIKKKGLRYKAINGNGIEVEKANESVTNLPKITASMLKILSDLNLKEPLSESTLEDDYL